jgi:DNA ligase 1
MQLSELIATSARVGETRSRLAKISAIAETLRRLEPPEIAVGVAYLSGDTTLSRLGVGYAALKDAWATEPAVEPTLTLSDVHAALSTIAATTGSGSAALRKKLLGGLFARATRDEQDFMARLIMGELRQGALEGIMVDAIAKAAGLEASAVRTAAMRAGSIVTAANAALTQGAEGLARFQLSVFTPLQPMLAQPAEDIADALSRLGEAVFDWKLDGARVQVHKAGDEVRVYSRSLNDVSAAVPEIVATVRALPSRTLILDGETIALREDGTPYPFQDTMRRFGRKLDVEGLRSTMPLSVYFFDCMLKDDDDLTALSLDRRLERLAEAVPSQLIMPRLVTSGEAAAQAFFDDSLARGHEGAMAKSRSAAYEAGGRGGAWLKIKQANTLDLVVIAVEWGSGRRSGWLSNLHLAAHDPDNGGFVMLGKTFKGMTDQMLAWQTERLLALETSREGHIVHVRPALVVEIAFNELQASNAYPGGMALRFARVKRYREDKQPHEADSIATVRAFFEAQLHRRG